MELGKALQLLQTFNYMIKYVYTNAFDCIQPSVNGSMPYRSGALYWDHTAQQYKVVDSQGNSEQVMGQTISFDIGAKLKDMLYWWEQKVREEKEIDALCKEYPNLAEARTEFETIKALVKDQNGKV